MYVPQELVGWFLIVVGFIRLLFALRIAMSWKLDTRVYGTFVVEIIFTLIIIGLGLAIL